jgi:hypothetical protein
MLPLSVRHVDPMDGFHLGGLLHQAVKELSAGTRSPAVEAEGKLVQVVIQMLAPDSALMGPDQPPL